MKSDDKVIKFPARKKKPTILVDKSQEEILKDRREKRESKLKKLFEKE